MEIVASELVCLHSSPQRGRDQLWLAMEAAVKDCESLNFLPKATSAKPAWT
jgi:hypothetical protein